METEGVLFEWKNHEFKDKERSNDWFWALGIIAVVGSAAAFVFSNFLFGVFVLIATTTMIFMATQKSKEQLHQITESGVIIGDEFLPYDSLKAFWLDDSEEGNFRLFLHTKKILNPVLTLHFDGYEEGDQIFEALEPNLEEKYLREPLSHQLFERLGF